jgi:hypothetical protein
MRAIGEKRPDVSALEEEVNEIQHRLGTPAERPNDLEQAKTLAHRLANLVCAALLQQDLNSDRNPANHCSQAPFSPA